MEFLQHYKPKLILLDILLPDINGYDILKKIKSDKRLKDTPIFFITALQESEVRQVSKRLGVEGYFKKPFKMAEFNILLNYLEGE